MDLAGDKEVVALLLLPAVRLVAESSVLEVLSGFTLSSPYQVHPVSVVKSIPSITGPYNFAQVFAAGLTKVTYYLPPASSFFARATPISWREEDVFYGRQSVCRLII